MKKSFQLAFFAFVVCLAFTSCSKDSEEIIDDSQVTPTTQKTFLSQEVTKILCCSATLSARLSSNTIPEISGFYQYGFILSRNSNPTNANGVVINSTDMEESTFYANIPNLAASTKYYYLPYIVVNGEYKYGSVGSFTTATFSEEYITLDASSLGKECIGHSYYHMYYIGYLTHASFSVTNSYGYVKSFERNYNEYTENIESISFDDRLSFKGDYTITPSMTYTDIEGINREFVGQKISYSFDGSTITFKE